MQIDEMTLEQAISAYCEVKYVPSKTTFEQIQDEMEREKLETATIQDPDWEGWTQTFKQGGLTPTLENQIRYTLARQELLEKKAAEQGDRFRAICRRASDLFERKNVEYDNSIERTGVVGAITAMTGDLSRARSMCLRSADHGRGVEENLRDKLQDLLVQSVIAIMMLDSGNWEGDG